MRIQLPKRRSALVETPPAPQHLDQTLLNLWLHDRPEHTKNGYQQEVNLFYRMVGKPLRAITIEDIEPFLNAPGKRVEKLSPASRARRLAALKSLFSYAYKTGYIPFNILAAQKLPKVPDLLHERIMTEEEVLRLFMAARDPLDHALLRFLYNSALRREEVQAMCWKDLRARDDTGQVAVQGKGGKVRFVLLKKEVWEEVQALRKGRPDEAPVFSLDGESPLSVSTIYRIVRGAAENAKIKKKISPHWLRHAHASHALDHGAPLSLIKETLGHSGATTWRYLHARPDRSSGEFLRL